MDTYLLPSSLKQSSMDLVKENLFDVWEREENNKFLFLNPERREIIDSFKLELYPLLPAWRRFKGPFWDNLHLWALPSAVQSRILQRGLIPSPVFGLLAPSDLVPPHRVGFRDKFKDKSLRSFWKEKLQNLFEKLLRDRVVLDLLGYDQRQVVSFPESSKVVRFSFVRAGKRVVNSLPHRAYVLRYVAERQVELDSLEKVNFLDYKVRDIKQRDNLIEVLMEGKGEYI